MHHAYGDSLWSMPGGRLEAGEDPVSALKREVLEEAGAVVQVTGLIGVYAATYNDDMVLLFSARLVTAASWEPNEEISDIGFFSLNDLPQPMSENMILRFRDISAGRTCIVRALSAPGQVIEQLSLG